MFQYMCSVVGVTANDVSVIVSFFWRRTRSVAGSWWVGHFMPNVTTSELPVCWLFGEQVDA